MDDMEDKINSFLSDPDAMEKELGYQGTSKNIELMRQTSIFNHFLVQ